MVAGNKKDCLTLTKKEVGGGVCVQIPFFLSNLSCESHELVLHISFMGLFVSHKKSQIYIFGDQRTLKIHNKGSLKWLNITLEVNCKPQNISYESMSEKSMRPRLNSRSCNIIR